MVTLHIHTLEFFVQKRPCRQLRDLALPQAERCNRLVYLLFVQACEPAETPEVLDARISRALVRVAPFTAWHQFFAKCEIAVIHVQVRIEQVVGRSEAVVPVRGAAARRSSSGVRPRWRTDN